MVSKTKDKKVEQHSEKDVEKDVEKDLEKDVEKLMIVEDVASDTSKKVSKKVLKKNKDKLVSGVSSCDVSLTSVLPCDLVSSLDNQVVENVSVVSDVSALTDSFTEFMNKFHNLVSAMSALKIEFKSLEKKAVREIKIAQKEKAKRKRKTGNRSPSGFVKPTLISTELAKFLGKPTGTEMARTEVTREINGYIRLHQLQDKENGRKINPDKSLSSLLKISNGEELTYINLQRYMSPHFAKAGGLPIN